MWTSKDVYYISDSTGTLVSNLGKSLICHFPEINFSEEIIPYVKTVDDARRVMKSIMKQSSGRIPIIFSSIVDPEVRKVLNTAEVEFVDAFESFLCRLEDCLEAKALRVAGMAHQADDQELDKRVEAIHFCLAHDDGTKQEEYEEADVIIIGVSRAGKTPVSVYLSTHMGLKSANLPLTNKYLESYKLPEAVVKNRKRVVGLTTNPELLREIRERRFPNSNYARLSTCTAEIKQAEQLFFSYQIPVINSVGKSIEELAAQVVQHL
jgi:[pyruvate, water dikinase]-phosphate phosphotransferase / [pyruvate, water dikinase] kinase